MNKRQSQILDLLTQNKKLKVTELSDVLNDYKVINLNFSRIGEVEGMLISSYSDPDVSYGYSWNDDKCYIDQNDYEYVRKLKAYRNEIKRALSSMNLYCSNDEMIRQINQYICETYSYKVINGKSFDMTENYEGQCMHYSMLFNNMCAAVGIDMDYVEGDTIRGPHGWN